MVASVGNGAAGGIGGQSWEAFSAAHSMDKNNNSNIMSPIQLFDTVEPSATDALSSGAARLAATHGLHNDSANFHDASYYLQPNPSTEWTRCQQSASSMDNPLALANSASVDYSVNHHDFSTQSQSVFIPEWRRTQQMADPRYNQVELFARCIESWGLAISADMGPASNIPLIQDPVYVKVLVPVDFLRCESMNYHLPEQHAKIQNSCSER
jgi:hypothetical protein